MLRVSVFLAAMAAALAAPAVKWNLMGRADGDEVIEFSAALPQRNLEVVEELLMQVSDPESADYGKYADIAAVNELTAPKPELFQEVRGWLESEPETSCSARVSSLRCRSTVAAMERTLKTEFSTFSHPVTGDLIHRVEGAEYEFPEEMHGKVLFLSGLTGFPVEHYGRARLVQPSAADPLVIPNTIATQYGLSGAKGSSSVTQAAAEFQNYPGYGDKDLTAFIQQAAIPSFSVVKKIGPFNGNEPQAESTLDVQYIGATGVGNANWYVTEAQWMYDFSESIVASPSTYPDVISMSYGWSESDQCQISPSSKPCQSGGGGAAGSAAFVQAVNANFMKYGTGGKTLLASSGDSGAHGRTDPMCQSKATRPAYPAASPYVTAVGATQFDTTTVKTGGSAPVCSSHGPCAVSGTEIVASRKTGALIVSGGGFSNVAPMPAYAHAAQSAYQKIAGAVPPAGDYNSSGRGYPDVAALGHKYYIQLDGQVVEVDGTSCSSPVWAGVVGLLNAAAAAKNQPKLGFLNPWIYKTGAATPAAFNDVVTGDNYCTEESCDCTTGFKATKGYDATTGFGTPNFPELVKSLDFFAAKRAAL